MSEPAHPGGLRLTDRAARLAGLTHDMILLDIGCGTGASLEMLARKFDVVAHGLDVSEDIIAAARENLPGAAFAVGDAACLPYKNDFFNAVICECVLSLLEDPLRAISEMRRVLSPGGTLVVSDICERSDIGRLPSVFESAGFDAARFEEHRAALVTYAADIHPRRRRAGIGNNTYYLMICRKR